MEKSGKVWRSLEHYPCDALCMDRGRFFPGHRRAYRCALPGFSRSMWQPVSGRGPYMGLPTDYEDDQNVLEPPEPIDEGCPGAWYRCRFVRSLAVYERTPNQDGALSENLRLSRCDDPLVLDAIQYLETERARARIHDQRRML